MVSEDDERMSFDDRREMQDDFSDRKQFEVEGGMVELSVRELLWKESQRKPSDDLAVVADDLRWLLGWQAVRGRRWDS